MLNFVRKYNLLSFSVIITIIYVFQFFLMPVCLPQFYPQAVGVKGDIIFYGPLIAFSILGNVIVDTKMFTWVIVDALYWALISIYNGMGYYGIGMFVAGIGTGPISYSSEWAAIIAGFIALVLLVFQASIRILRLLFIIVKRRVVR